MNSYIKQLQSRAAAANEARHAEQERAAEQAARERLTPLETRVARVLATIPSAVQAEGLSLPALQTLLRGRWKGNAHPGELGEALRKLGFTRQRRWRGEAGFCALWYGMSPRSWACPKTLRSSPYRPSHPSSIPSRTDFRQLQ
jgi:hypothetical protein